MVAILTIVLVLGALLFAVPFTAMELLSAYPLLTLAAVIIGFLYVVAAAIDCGVREDREWAERERKRVAQAKVEQERLESERERRAWEADRACVGFLIAANHVVAGRPWPPKPVPRRELSLYPGDSERGMGDLEREMAAMLGGLPNR